MIDAVWPVVIGMHAEVAERCVVASALLGAGLRAPFDGLRKVPLFTIRDARAGLGINGLAARPAAAAGLV